jgi:nucleoid-associated protein YgaU
MAKETKIGLAIVGVLLAVFGGLLVRYMFFTGGTQEAPAGQPPVSVAQSASEQANVVVAQHGAQANAGPVDAQVPSGSYMPAEGEPAPLPDDPYAASVPTGRQASAAQPPGPSPFQNYDAGEQPPAAAANARENPLRQLNAELPLETSGAREPAEAGAEEAPVANDSYTADPAATRDPFATAESDAEQAGPAEIPDASAIAPDAIGYGAADAPGAGVGAGDRYSADKGPVAEPAPRSDEPAQAQDGLDNWQPGEGAEPVRQLAVENGKYTVQPGDTLWSISEGVYGTGGYFKALAEHNREVLPRSHELTVGHELAVPPVAELERDYPGLCPKQRKSALVPPGGQPRPPARAASGSEVYIVAEGDTLFDIARYELGKASRWAEIYELNRELLGEDFDYLRPGTELAMPPRTRPAASIARDADEGYQR